MTTRIMLDFETLSLKENAVLLAIGACTFDPATGEIGAEFYAAIDPRTQHGRDIDASTVLWWMKQDEAARTKITSAIEAADAVEAGLPDELTDEAQALIEADAAFSIQAVARGVLTWIGTLGDDIEVWSNGAVDHAWFNSMFEYAGYKNPIPFWKQRDYRTLKALFPEIKREDYGVAHNALDDAIGQAKHACAVMQHSDDTRAAVGLDRQYVAPQPAVEFDDDIPF